MDASIYYTLIIKNFQRVSNVSYDLPLISYQLFVLEVVDGVGQMISGILSGVLLYMVSASVLLLFFPFLCYYEFQIQNINWGQPTTYIMYPYMTPQTHQFSSFMVT